MRRLGLLCLGLVLTTCSRATTSPIAEKPLSQQFSLVAAGETALTKSVVGMNPDDLVMTIDRTVLEQPLLFLPTYVTDSTPYGMPGSLDAKKVFFTLSGDKLYLMENMEGQSVPGPFKPEKIIAEFPVVEADETTITFDFKEGLDQLIFPVSSWYSGERMDFAFKITASYLRDPIAEGDVFGVSHVAQINYWDQLFTLTFSYTFVPDRVSLFQPIEEPAASAGVGYFLSPAVFERGDGDPKRFITRWDISQPVVFSISPNTPDEFRDAIREGIEVWNEVFGRTVVTVQEAPEGTVIGDPRYNMFQWIEWDDFVTAYADWHTHPLTGEILKANVIFPSAWAVYGQRQAKRILKILDRMNNEETASPRPALGLRGFSHAKLCDYRLSSSYEQYLEQVARGEVSEEIALKLAQRIVKTVAMHEVGHDLGLRHNFAGNLGTEMSPTTDRSDLLTLLTSGDRPDDAALPASSIMDYGSIADDFRMEHPGSYDRAAIRWGYLASPEEREQTRLPLFCTDGDYWYDADCQRWDAWADPLEWRIHVDAPQNVELLNRVILDRLAGEDDEEDGYRDPSLRYLLGDIFGMTNYINGMMDVRSLGGRSMEERIARAGKGLSPYLWSGDSTTAPAGALVTRDLIAKRGELMAAASQDGDAAMMLAEIEQSIVAARSQVVALILWQMRNNWVCIAGNEGEKWESVLNTLMNQGPEALTVCDVSDELSVAEPAVRPLLQGLVGLSGNAGIDTWFADRDVFRRVATLYVSIAGNEVGAEAQTALRRKLMSNISAFETMLAQEMYNPDRTVWLEERIAFEEELLMMLRSVTLPLRPAGRRH